MIVKTLSLCLLLLLSVVATAENVPVTLESLIKLRTSASQSTATNYNARQSQIILTAKRLGTSGGFAEYSAEARSSLDKHRYALDSIYHFAYIMIPTETGAQVLPPVVEEYGPEVIVHDNGAILEEKDARLVIVKPARLIASSHSWRSYLYFPTAVVSKGDPREWPQDESEQALWETSLVTAWQRGREQAARLFDRHFSDLEADYIGMLRYLEYVEKGMLDQIYVAGNDLGVKVSKNGQSMEIGGRFVRITKQARFNGNIDAWEPISIPIDWEGATDAP